MDAITCPEAREGQQLAAQKRQEGSSLELPDREHSPADRPVHRTGL